MGLKRLKKRHGRSIIFSLSYELFIRTYRYAPVFRRFILLFMTPKAPKGLFFLVGSYNAGTTIIKQTVALHPSVSSAPIEGDLLTSELNNMEEDGWHRCLYGNKDKIENYRSTHEINPENILRDWTPWIKNNVYFLEKSIANSVRVNQLRKAFPGCKFINVIRSPEGVVNGIKKRSKPTDLARKKLGADTYPDKLLFCQWSYIYDLIQTDSKKSDTFNCSYEGFISNPNESTKALYDFLELNSVPISFKDNTLNIGDKKLYIRPSSITEEPVDYTNPEILKSEIERLRCN